VLEWLDDQVDIMVLTKCWGLSGATTATKTYLVAVVEEMAEAAAVESRMNDLEGLVAAMTLELARTRDRIGLQLVVDLEKRIQGHWDGLQDNPD
jgi:hypothetical protein